MTFEIERRFLLKKEPDWKKAISIQYITQGYIHTAADKVIRLRTVSERDDDNDQAFITVKGKNVGAKRIEIETPIDPKIAHDLLANFSVGHAIKKIRYSFKIGDLIWEVDKFGPPCYGLHIAEVELEHEDQDILIPGWVGLEITDDYRYSNSSLAENPWPFE